MKKFAIIGIIVLALVILVGFVLSGNNSKKSVASETVTIKNPDTESAEECLDDCANCPESESGECATGPEAGDVRVKDASSKSLEHEKGSPECLEAQKSGKCPGKCPHSGPTETQKTDKI
jgi:hypothetical protein